jgi:alkylation response protein AidB-like acyl-CoA dehydrogenase
MSDLQAYRAKASAWLQKAAGKFSRTASKGLGEAEALALTRLYQRAKFDAGYAGIHWPAEVGGHGLGPLEKLAFESEELACGISRDHLKVSLGMAVPMIVRFCTDRAWVRTRALAALKGEEIWCQLFSEPAAGSDLAGLRSRAIRDGDDWLLNGQKLWTSYAHHADYGVIVVRTDPAVPKHKGLTYFWVDMKAPGVTVRPVKLATGDAHVNEIFFDDVRLSDNQRMGEVGGGFALAIATLMIERHAISDPDGMGPPLDLFISLAREMEVNERPAIQDGRIRAVIARNYAMRSGLQAITARATAMLHAGMEPGPEGSLAKLVSVRSRQKLSELAMDLTGTSQLALDPDAAPRDDWTNSWLGAPTLRIAGGADEMLLNTIAEKILGLPQDHRPDKGVPFNRIPA